MKVKRHRPEVNLPSRKHASAAYDLHMPIQGVVRVGDVVDMGLGISVAIPEGHGGFILPRSGFGIDYGLQLLNTEGLIDEDYRGMLRVVFKVTVRDLEWSLNERLFQMAVKPVHQEPIEEVFEFDETARGAGGFGSTGR